MGDNSGGTEEITGPLYRTFIPWL